MDRRVTSIRTAASTSLRTVAGSAAMGTSSACMLTTTARRDGVAVTKPAGAIAGCPRDKPRNTAVEPTSMKDGGTTITRMKLDGSLCAARSSRSTPGSTSSADVWPGYGHSYKMPGLGCGVEFRSFCELRVPCRARADAGFFKNMNVEVAQQNQFPSASSAISNSLVTVFQFRPVTGVLKILSIRANESLLRPTPFG